MTTTRDPRDLEEIERAHQQAAADEEEAIQTFGREQTYEAFVAIRHAWARKWNLKVIETLAQKFRNALGCPHEEGIDYEGQCCRNPGCAFWHGRDRFTGKLVQ